MAGFILGSDEVVVCELHKARENKTLSLKLYNITLTNKRIIVCKAGTLGKDKFEYEKKLSEVKTFDDTAQVKVNSVGGTVTRIDIYLSSEQLSFTLNGAGNTDAIQFANSLNHLVTDSNTDIYSITGNATGKDAFKQAFFGMNNTELKKEKNEKVAIRCTSCGVSFEGIKGKVSKCPYCGTFFNS